MRHTNTRSAELRSIMQMAWQFIKRNGFGLSEALKQAWLVFKTKARMYKGIVKFYFKKVDGTMREAYGTLNPALMPAIDGNDRRAKCPTVQVYFDTEKQEFRCFKIANLVTL